MHDSGQQRGEIIAWQGSFLCGRDRRYLTESLSVQCSLNSYNFSGYNEIFVLFYS